jgi:hypothetical protein
LILLCMVSNPYDCAIPAAPVTRTEDQCKAVIVQVLARVRTSESLFVARVECYKWPEQA